MKNPLVSIITPVYNRYKIISETIESIFSQTYDHWEYIIIDDGSTDNTLNVINKYALKDNRLRVYSRQKEPKGANKCRNIGMEKSKGKYIIFLDSDDLLADFCLMNRVKYIENHANLDFAVFPCLRFEKNPYDLNLFMSSYHGKEVIPLFLKRDIPWGSLNPIYKRYSLIDNGILWNERIKLYQDIDFHLKTVCRGLQFHMPETKPDCFWRSHGNMNINHNLNMTKNIDSNVLLLQSISHELFNSNNLTKSNKRIIEKVYLIGSINDSIYKNSYNPLYKLIYTMFELKLISYFTFLIMKSIYCLKNKSLLRLLYKNYCIIFNKIYGMNKTTFYLNKYYKA